MSIAIGSSVTKSDKVTLFTSKDDFDTWLAGLHVPDATTSARGVVLQASDPGDVSGSSIANNQTKINALLAVLRTSGVIVS
jgi:hypothetical protein